MPSSSQAIEGGTARRYVTTNKLEGKKIAIVVTDGFEQVELTSPKEALEKEGAICEIISPKEGRVRGWKHVEWGDELRVDVPLAQAKVDDYDGRSATGRGR